ncbi:hypothetical protein PGT21_019485 [Puccinia graminis f. sp. tritici]|uniref:Secreted protein n=2 Tax=Puccinia graminis f. sp. tritici TaxID=56615 RepID=E3K109_PUCGT|nr:uncharacterized protein PGTG_03940 [Puccinia graminis f. sp. tritici CRL 75-36-700-3]EFP77984.2 hypothetical protein PGTG_03940 [Puccinia graminis f. sp. tritici CRL 75-36-700-3]KAA1096539.1 hypothetical protein PGT21_019485 [Puccinia graminis f. sp. tritici]
MLFMNFFQAASIGLAFLPIIIILHSGQVALVDGGGPVNCISHFDSEDGSKDVSCWVDSQTKLTCPKTSCNSRLYPERHYGQIVYYGCQNDDVRQYWKQVIPRNYHHYPTGDNKWRRGQKGFVAAFDGRSQTWYNCAYDFNNDNKDTYSESLCA